MAAADTSAEEALALAAEAGIHRLPLPTPFLVGRVNCYLIEDEPLTLIDTGPNSGKALDELELALAARGRRIEDLELIVVTHQHLDHIGLLDILVRRSGAEVAAFHRLAPYLAEFSENMDDDDRFAEALMRSHGVPADMVIALRAVASAFRAWGSSGRVTIPLSDGDTLELHGRTLRVLHRPGHSPSDTVFLDERRRLALAGDHLIAHTSSNPFVSRPLGADPGVERPRALITYIDSMRATRDLDIALTLPGHGDPIRDHRTLIDQRFSMHDRRARKMLELIRDQPRTAYEIARAMWGNAAVTQAYLTLSEVLGHLDILLRDGRAREATDGGVVRFLATGREAGG
ncbi:MAG TPA: MBL fold metallo-hydrolase [Solirubrobacteraceae bacterium]|nr:MBL fold metallo-hydrolase [Solirubrobacteraceae bacterium]